MNDISFYVKDNKKQNIKGDRMQIKKEEKKSRIN